MTRPYLTVDRLGRLATTLSQRDHDILHTLQVVRVATGAQLGRLHFVDVTDRDRRHVLHHLVAKRLLARLDRQIGGARAGSAGFVYSLDIAGQRLLHHGPGAGTGSTGRRPWTPGWPFLAHSLAITELYVRSVEASRRGDLHLVSFETEPVCWRAYLGPGGARLILKPDALAQLRVDGFDDYWWVEVDRGTESPRTLARKCDQYRHYWSTGAEQARLGLFPRVLFLVPDRRRQTVLVDVCGRQPADAWPLFSVAPFDDAVARFRQGVAA